MSENGRLEAVKRKATAADGSDTAKCSREENKEAGHSSRQHKHRKRAIPDVVVRKRTNNTATVYRDYSCRLKLLEGDDANSFFVIQVIEHNNKVAVFTRWGQQGEEGEWRVKKESTVKDAMVTFKKMFREKTANGWEKRKKFVHQLGKYHWQEGYEEPEEELEDYDEESESESEKSEDEVESVRELDARTELMIRLILDYSVLAKQISVMKLDERKVTPETISESMLTKAEEALANIERAFKLRKSSTELGELWSKFFKAVPHKEEGKEGPTRQLGEAAESFLHKSREHMNILCDIRSTCNLLDAECEDENIDPRELYKLLGCHLRLVKRETEEFKLVKQYSRPRKNGRQFSLLDVWSIDRPGEKARYSEHVGLHYRKLLWHSVNVASVAAILKCGLRITPFSGGPLGKGIYLTPEHSKCAWNAGVHWGKYEEERNVGFMFLVEAALGRMKYIKMGNTSLTHPPDGFNSIAAKGRLEPDASKDKIKLFDGNRVIVPVGLPEPQKEFEGSGFLHSEYVVYNERQVRLRYLVKFSFA